MKKNKLTFLIVTSALALSALIGCGNKKQLSSVLPSSENSVEPPSSNVLSSSEVIAPSSEAPKSSSSETSKPSSSAEPSSEAPRPSSSELPSSSDFSLPPITTEIPFPPGGSSQNPGSSQAQLVSLVGIELTPPTKSLYTTDDTALDLTGMVLKAKYSDGSKRVVSSGYTVSEVDFSTPGQKEVHVTYFSFDSYFLINVQQAAPKDWTSEQKALMGAHLHGLVLPYVSIPCSVTYDNSMEGIVIESENRMEGDFLNEYAALFSEADGWQGGEISSYSDLDPDLMFEFRRPVVQEEKTYYVSVFLEGFEPVGTDDGYPSKTGYLYLMATDPYVYEYPATHINSATQHLYNSSIFIPSIEADYYWLDDYGFIAYSATNTENSYKALVEATGNFVFDANKDEYNYYRAHAIDTKYDLKFKYDEEEKGLIVYLAYCAPKVWPAELISEKMAEHDMVSDTLPALSDNVYMYKISDNDENYDLVISALAGSGRIDQFYSSYNTILNNNEFDYDNVTQLYTSPNGEYTVKLEDDGVCTFYIKLKVKYGVWPSAELAAIYETLGFNQDYVPEPTYGNGLLRPRDYKLSQNDDGSYLITATFLKSEDSEDVYRTKEAYFSYLREDLGFTESFYDGSGRYWRISPNAEFCIQSDCWKNYMYITFKPYVPSNGYDECMERVVATLGEDLTPPDLEVSDALKYRSETYWYDGTKIGTNIFVQFDVDVDIDAKYLELVNSLKDQGYHYTKLHNSGGYINDDRDTSGNFCPLIKVAVDSSTYLSIRVERADVSLTGYVLAMVEYNENGYIINWNRWFGSYDEENNYYVFNGISFEEDQRFFAYDLTNEIDFFADIDNRSLNGNWNDYFAYDSENNEYVVLQDFTANFYLHLEDGNNYFYIQDPNQPQDDYPSQQIAQFLNGLEVSSCLTQPFFEDATYEWTAPTNEDPLGYLTITQEDADYAEIAEQYEYYLFDVEGFYQRTAEIGGQTREVYLSPNRDYFVYITYSENEAIIAICNRVTLEESIPLYANYALVYQEGDSWIFNDGAKIYAYIWGGSYLEPFWVELQYDSLDDCFYLEGIDDSANIIIARMDPSATTPNWDDVWNQTSDISLSDKDEMVVFHINP